jgi:hypothetical protein
MLTQKNKTYIILNSFTKKKDLLSNFFYNRILVSSLFDKLFHFLRIKSFFFDSFNFKNFSQYQLFFNIFQYILNLTFFITIAYFHNNNLLNYNLFQVNQLIFIKSPKKLKELNTEVFNLSNYKLNTLYKHQINNNYLFDKFNLINIYKNKKYNETEYSYNFNNINFLFHEGNILINKKFILDKDIFDLWKVNKNNLFINNIQYKKLNSNKISNNNNDLLTNKLNIKKKLIKSFLKIYNY